MSNIHSLDIATADVDGNGVRDFFWPISWREQLAFRDALIGGYASLARSLIEKQDQDGDLLAILAMEFIQEVMRGWFVAGLIARYGHRGECMSASWLQGTAANEPDFWRPQRDRIGFLRDRFPASAWRNLLRPLYGLTQKDNLSWRWPQTVDFRRRIIATNPCALTKQHALQSGERPVLVSLRYWFGMSSDTIPSDLSSLALRKETVSSILTMLDNAARKSCDSFPPALINHLKSWLNEAASICRWHLRCLLDRPASLPAQLWTGSSGYIFRRILQVAVRRAGGTACSHDHGSGLGLFAAPNCNMTEFVTPNKFITFSEQQAAGYRSQRREDFRIQADWPEVESVSRDRTKPPIRLPAIAASIKPKRILLVANQYRGEKLPLIPIEFDLVAIDWQARLFSQLRALGYDVHMRPHPDSWSLPPVAFESTLGVQIERGSFSEALAGADVVVMEYLHTSALREVLLSGKPVFTFEFGHCPPNAVANDALSRRIRFIPAWYDEQNRAQTDWAALPAAIADACDMRGDTAFIELL